MATKQVNFRIPEELIEAAQEKAYRKKISVAEYFRGLLEKDLKIESSPVMQGRPKKTGVEISAK